MNKIILTGRLARDIEVLERSGTQIFKNALAVERPFKKDVTDFFNITSFNKTAEIMGQYLQKGSKILVDGQLQTNEYTDKEGNKRTSYDVIVNQFEFLETKAQAQQNNQSGQTSKPQADPFENSGNEIDLDDSFLPF